MGVFMRYEKLKEKINKMLEDYNQTIRVEEISSDMVLLSNGLLINDLKEVTKFKNRANKSSDDLKSNWDDLYSLNENVRKETKRKLDYIKSSNAGKKAQRNYGDKIRKNLNTDGKGPWNKDLKGNYPYKPKFTEETRRKISLSKKGKKNAMYGRRHSDEYKREASERVKQKILSGEFTPNSNNKNTHWQSTYNGKSYRSSWEALYQYFDPNADYEAIRIPYEYNDKTYVYIVDFINTYDNLLIEVKPKSFLNDEKTRAKIDAAKKWCQKHGYTFIIADEYFFYNKGMPSDYDGFDDLTKDKIGKFYEAGEKKNNRKA